MKLRLDTIFAITAVCMVVLSTVTLGVGVGLAASSTLDAGDSLTEWNGKATSYTADMFTRSGFSLDDRVVTHGTAGYPGWYVSYNADDDGAYDELTTWAGRSDDRRILEHDADDGRVLLVAPGDHIRRMNLLSADGLSTAAYVEWIEPELRVERVEPVTLETKTAVDNEHGPARVVDWYAAANGGDFAVEQGNESGVAFSGDVNKTDMSDVKQANGADADSISPTADGSGVTIAVLDTGANVRDGEVFGNGTAGSEIRITHGKNFVTGETINRSADDFAAIEDGNLHGTYTAARIAGAGNGNESLRSPAYKANLAVGKVLADDGSGSIEQVVDGLEWACSPAVDADVVSMSLGAPTYSKTLEDEIHSCLDDEDVSAITVAAGNSRWTWGRANLGSPADADGVIAVAATSTDAPDNMSSAYFSNTGDDGGAIDGSGGYTRGERPDLGAPGMENTVTIVDSGGRVTSLTLSGTSMSTPDVAAAAALLVDEDPSLEGDHELVRERLLETASPAKKIGITEIGNGALNVSNALEDTRPRVDQADARTEQAIARDEANLALAGRVGTWLRQRGLDV